MGTRNQCLHINPNFPKKFFDFTVIREYSNQILVIGYDRRLKTYTPAVIDRYSNVYAHYPKHGFKTFKKAIKYLKRLFGIPRCVSFNESYIHFV